MPVPTLITDLSQTIGSNSPAGGDSPTTTDDYLRALSAFIAQLRDGVGFASGVGVIQPGTMLDFGGTSAPSGYLACDGSAVSRTTYAALFAAIGTTWGPGNGTTTFNLPNIARRVTVGSGGTGTGTLANTVGSTGGAETHTLSSAEMPSHTHTASTSITDPGHTHSGVVGDSAVGNVPAGGSTVVPTGNTVIGTSSTGITASTTVNSAGSGGAHNNLQPSAVVLKIIKY